VGLNNQSDMYDINDTIVAISSPPGGARTIVRITGPATIEICRQVFKPTIDKLKTQNSKLKTIIAGSVAIDAELEVDAMLHLFFAPHSYTGDDVAEIHLFANPAVTEVLVDKVLTMDERRSTRDVVRMAGPGEFTARAYLNGKIDLAQAEAVNEIVVSSNTYQLEAAEKLLSGRLAETTAKVRSAIMDCLSLLEAGLDFSQEDIEFISKEQAIERLTKIKNQLEKLFSGSISYESIIDLPAVGIAGAPNAGKSSLLNKLLGQQRSIVSDQPKTTRDVLTGELLLAHCRCVLFDCAGLTQKTEDRRQKTEFLSSVLDELAQSAAIKALQSASLVLFCVEVSKSNWLEDVAIGKLINPNGVIPVATKSDLHSEKMLVNRLAWLNELFSAEFLPVSVKTGAGLDNLRDAIDKKLLGKFKIPRESGLALMVRHKQVLTLAIDNISETINELKAGNDEVAATMLRAAYQALSDIESASGRIDEQILDRIFSRFCIGK